jgi:hypothetical protein
VDVFLEGRRDDAVGFGVVQEIHAAKLRENSIPLDHRHH